MNDRFEQTLDAIAENIISCWWYRCRHVNDADTVAYADSEITLGLIALNAMHSA